MTDPTPSRAPLPAFLPGPPIDRTRLAEWQRWVHTRDAFVPAPVMGRSQYLRLSPRRRRLHDLHRLATHSSLPVLSTPMSDAVAWLVKARIEDGAYSHKAGIRTGVMVSGGGAQGKTETVCAALAAFEADWLEVNEFMNPQAMPGTRDLVAPVAYVRCPVKATPVSTCQRILDFYGEDYKNMRQEDLIRTVNAAIAAHATKALVIDDITRLKLHRESDQDVLDLLLEVMSMSVTLILVGVGIPLSGLLRRGRFDPVTKQWAIPPVKDRGRSPNPQAATQHERRFEMIELNPFSYDSNAEINAWENHLVRLEQNLRLLNDTEGMLSSGSMPEYLFSRTNGVVGLLEKLIQRGCRLSIEEGSERLDTALLDRCQVSPTDLPDLDAESGEQPVIPPVKNAAAKKRTKPRNGTFDDSGPAAQSAG
ncbi:AAA family ATPase [Streptomyces sp. NBC_01363]|uniref:AAA family ATPase n=1 Tax=Streptomyces sp. NBC_01363 TaxID=2903840 RepID=UPI00224CBD01|nr:AAA family ATPase [Streptomyces sp. NBC_01363]MCX4734099.1 AAA family ATPase [Streptomyces sp. NBC_01363]